jgi:peptidyl-prolyl cis-trans isomerase SurA
MKLLSKLGSAVTLCVALTVSPVSAQQEVELDSIIALVNDDIVLASDFVRERANLLRQNRAGLPRDAALDKFVIERLIVQSLQLQQAELRGIRIDDSSLQRALDDMARNNNMSVAQMRETLAKDGINFLEFRENIRKELIVSTLTRREIESNLNVSDAEVEDLLNEELAGDSGYRYELEHILVKLPQQADANLVATSLTTAQSLASEARDGVPFARLVEIQRNLGNTEIEGGNLGSRSLQEMPGLFANQVEGMQEGDVTEPLRSGAGFHVIKLVGRSSNNDAGPSRVRARHILASTRNGTSEAAAKAKIDRVYALLQDGASFESLATEFSDDPGSAANGGDLGWFNRGEMVPKFEQLAFESEPNQVSEPFNTQFGWHILEVLDQELTDNPRTQLETKARETLRRQKAEEQYEAWLTRLRDNAYVELRGFAKNFQ